VPVGERFPTGDYVYQQSTPSGTYFDRIEDVLDPSVAKKVKKKDFPLPNHDAHHVKVRWFHPRNLADYVHTAQDDRLILDRWFVADDINATLTLMPGLGSGTLSSLADIAFPKLYEQVPTQISIANFAYELKDWKEMIPSFSRNLKESVTGNFLGLEFGWKPFVSDLKKIGGLVENVSKRLQYLRDTYGKRVRVSAFGDTPDLTISADAYSNADTSPNDPHFGVRYHRKDYRGTWRAQGYLTHQLIGLDDDLTQIKAFTAALGLNNPLRVYWNAIPYSFVVDWLVRIGALLDRLSIQPFQGQWIIEDVTFTYEEKCTFWIYQRTFYHDEPNLFIGTGTIERYYRQLGLPASTLWLTDAGLDSRQQLLALALIHQRI
jgi:hypothetical protein